MLFIIYYSQHGVEHKVCLKRPRRPSIVQLFCARIRLKPATNIPWSLAHIHSSLISATVCCNGSRQQSIIPPKSTITLGPDWLQHSLFPSPPRYQLCSVPLVVNVRKRYDLILDQIINFVFHQISSLPTDELLSCTYHRQTLVRTYATAAPKPVAQPAASIIGSTPFRFVPSRHNYRRTISYRRPRHRHRIYLPSWPAISSLLRTLIIVAHTVATCNTAIATCNSSRSEFSDNSMLSQQANSQQPENQQQANSQQPTNRQPTNSHHPTNE